MRRELAELCEVLDSSYHLRCVRILVVVPRNNLYLIGVVVKLDNHGLSGIEERTVAHAQDIAGDDRSAIIEPIMPPGRPQPSRSELISLLEGFMK